MKGAGATLPWVGYFPPAGSSSTEIGNPWRFQGRRFDQETGFYYFRLRHLDPGQGRFVNRDPIGVWGDAGNLGNGYSFCGNDPVNRVDPMGLDAAQVAGDAVARLEGEFFAAHNAAMKAPAYADAYVAASERHTLLYMGRTALSDLVRTGALPYTGDPIYGGGVGDGIATVTGSDDPSAAHFVELREWWAPLAVGYAGALVAVVAWKAAPLAAFLYTRAIFGFLAAATPLDMIIVLPLLNWGARVAGRLWGPIATTLAWVRAGLFGPGYCGWGFARNAYMQSAPLEGGKTLWYGVGRIKLPNYRSIVDQAVERGQNVTIISGAHGHHRTGQLTSNYAAHQEDLELWGHLPNVRIVLGARLTDAKLKDALHSADVVVYAVCHGDKNAVVQAAVKAGTR